MSGQGRQTNYDSVNCPAEPIYGMASGTVDAMLASLDGNRIHLTGSWACVVEIDKSVS